ncbi:unnamed protein product [Amoebophrya sp. A120]|nr:unnamed protein product [Amoebophrya sp. A120]|eukprot:GSA120T00015234001.1
MEPAPRQLEHEIEELKILARQKSEEILRAKQRFFSEVGSTANPFDPAAATSPQPGNAGTHSTASHKAVQREVGSASGSTSTTAWDATSRANAISASVRMLNDSEEHYQSLLQAARGESKNSPNFGNQEHPQERDAYEPRSSVENSVSARLHVTDASASQLSEIPISYRDSQVGLGPAQQGHESGQAASRSGRAGKLTLSERLHNRSIEANKVEDVTVAKNATSQYSRPQHPKPWSPAGGRVQMTSPASPTGALSRSRSRVLEDHPPSQRTNRRPSPSQSPFSKRYRSPSPNSSFHQPRSPARSWSSSPMLGASGSRIHSRTRKFLRSNSAGPAFVSPTRMSDSSAVRRHVEDGPPSGGAGSLPNMPARSFESVSSPLLRTRKDLVGERLSRVREKRERFERDCARLIAENRRHLTEFSGFDESSHGRARPRVRDRSAPSAVPTRNEERSWRLREQMAERAYLFQEELQEQKSHYGVRERHLLEELEQMKKTNQCLAKAAMDPKLLHGLWRQSNHVALREGIRSAGVLRAPAPKAPFVTGSDGGGGSVTDDRERDQEIAQLKNAIQEVQAQQKEQQKTHSEDLEKQARVHASLHAETEARWKKEIEESNRKHEEEKRSWLLERSEAAVSQLEQTGREYHRNEEQNRSEQEQLRNLESTTRSRQQDSDLLRHQLESEITRTRYEMETALREVEAKHREDLRYALEEQRHMIEEQQRHLLRQQHERRRTSNRQGRGTSSRNTTFASASGRFQEQMGSTRRPLLPDHVLEQARVLDPESSSSTSVVMDHEDVVEKNTTRTSPTALPEPKNAEAAHQRERLMSSSASSSSGLLVRGDPHPDQRETDEPLSGVLWAGDAAAGAVSNSSADDIEAALTDHSAVSGAHRSAALVRLEREKAQLEVQLRKFGSNTTSLQTGDPAGRGRITTSNSFQSRGRLVSQTPTATLEIPPSIIVPGEMKTSGSASSGRSPSTEATLAGARGSCSSSSSRIPTDLATLLRVPETAGEDAVVEAVADMRHVLDHVTDYMSNLNDSYNSSASFAVSGRGREDGGTKAQLGTTLTPGRGEPSPHKPSRGPLMRRMSTTGGGRQDAFDGHRKDDYVNDRAKNQNTMLIKTRKTQSQTKHPVVPRLQKHMTAAASSSKNANGTIELVQRLQPLLTPLVQKVDTSDPTSTGRLSAITRWLHRETQASQSSTADPNDSDGKIIKTSSAVVVPGACEEEMQKEAIKACSSQVSQEPQAGALKKNLKGGVDEGEDLQDKTSEDHEDLRTKIKSLREELREAHQRAEQVFELQESHKDQVLRNYEKEVDYHRRHANRVHQTWKTQLHQAAQHVPAVAEHFVAVASKLHADDFLASKKKSAPRSEAASTGTGGKENKKPHDT